MPPHTEWTPPPAGSVGFVGSYLALLAAGSWCYLCCLFLGLVFWTSNLLPGALPLSAFLIGPVLTTLVYLRLKRRLRSATPMAAVGLTLTTCVAMAGAWMLLFIMLNIFLGRDYVLEGPTSPLGHRTQIQVYGCGLGWDAEVYSDVVVIDATGQQVATWRDSRGQFPRGGPEQLRDSMRWESAAILQFDTTGGLVTLDAKR